MANDVLGITNIDAFIFKPGFVAGFIHHVPSVDLNGPAVLSIQFGDESVVLPFLIDLAHNKWVNPAGLPLLKGVENVLIFYVKLFGPWADKSLSSYYDGLPIGADVPVSCLELNFPIIIKAIFQITFKVYTKGPDTLTLTLLGCAQYSLKKPDYGAVAKPGPVPHVQDEPAGFFAQVSLVFHHLEKCLF